MSFSQAFTLPAADSEWAWNAGAPMLAYVTWEPRDVLLQGIPEAVCNNRDFVEAMLEQAGVEWAVLKHEVQHHPGREYGDVLVTLVNQDAAHQCLQAFYGCQWGAHRVARVRAKLLGADARPAMSKQESSAGSPRLPGPRWVEKSSGDSATAKDANKAVACSTESGVFVWETLTKPDPFDSDLATNASESSVKLEDSDDDRKILSLTSSPTRSVRWADLSDDEDF
jgi:hypothetical protein